MLNYPIMYSLYERECSSKHAKNCVYLSSFYHQEFDLSMSSVENYICSLEIHNWCKCLDCDMGK